MNASRSLFATAFKDQRQRPAFGIKKSIPFLNYWVPAPPQQRNEVKRSYSTDTEREFSRTTDKMASATSFYDFKPLDSMYNSPDLGCIIIVPSMLVSCTSIRTSPDDP